jgi:Predicted hydrolases or acyltransferases (alpha/beta hydrolase superfamily)
MLLNHKIYPRNHSAEYLFILHGLFGMLDNWHNMARKLSAHYNVVTVDLRNHGHSEHTSEMSFELMAQDLVELMDFESRICSCIGSLYGRKSRYEICRPLL